MIILYLSLIVKQIIVSGLKSVIFKFTIVRYISDCLTPSLEYFQYIILFEALFTIYSQF